MISFGLTLGGGKGTDIPASLPLVPLLANLSASQLKTYYSCKRKWAFDKVYGVRPAEKHHFVIGHALHNTGERYLTRQAKSWAGLFPPGWDRQLEQSESEWIRFCAEQAVTKGIWQASPGLKIEHPIVLLVGEHFRDARGMPLAAEPVTYEDDKGVRRIATPTRMLDGSPLPIGWNALPPVVGFIDQIELTSAIPWVVDHKTAKSRKYALSKAKLAEDTQVNLYSAYVLGLRPDVEQVNLRHNVFLKDSQDAKTVFNTDAITELPRVRAKWSEVMEAAAGMQEVRRQSPRSSHADPLRRADNCLSITSALDDKRPDACKEYGGCPYRDVCFGNASAQQLIRRLDTPSIAPLVRKVAVKYNLISRSTPQLSLPEPTPLIQTQEQPMPFISPSISSAMAICKHKIVYLLDPDNKLVQYRGKVRTELPGDMMEVGLHPDLQIDASEIHLPDVYIITVPKDQLSAVMIPGAKLTGYADALFAAGMITGIGWEDSVGRKHAPGQPVNLPVGPSAGYNTTPAATPLPAAFNTSHGPAPTVPPAVVAPPVKDNRPPRDNKFGFQIAAGTPLAAAATKGEAVAAQFQRAAQAEEGALASIPPQTFDPAMGMRVQVIPTDHQYFASLVGQIGTITDISEGETQPVVSVTFDSGLSLGDVAIGRLAPQGEATASGLPKVGEQVSILKAGGLAPIVCTLEALTPTHIVAMGGKLTIAHTDIVSITKYVAPPAPLTKEQKAAVKAAEKQAAEDAKLPQDLSSLMLYVNDVLTGGKASKKVLETVAGSLEIIQKKEITANHMQVPQVPHTQAQGVDVERIQQHLYDASKAIGAVQLLCAK